MWSQSSFSMCDYFKGVKVLLIKTLVISWQIYCLKCGIQLFLNDHIDLFEKACIVLCFFTWNQVEISPIKFIAHANSRLAHIIHVFLNWSFLVKFV